MLLGLNIFFFLVLPFKDGLSLPSALAEQVTAKEFVTVQAFLYESFIKESQPKQWQLWTERFHQSLTENKGEELENFWYQMSFRDGVFLKTVADGKAYPDTIRHEQWKKTFLALSEYQKKDFSGLFGVSINGSTWTHFITYQFIHAGFLHLFSNMVILVMFGVLVELQFGSWSLLLVYLIGGMLGGLFYSLTSGTNMAPLIGASGSVSALIAFLLILEPRKNLRFFYFFFPSPDYFGDIYLSKWWLISLLILGDINAILTNPDWNLGVAHTAHLGAILFGLVCALLVRFVGVPSNLGQALSWVQGPEETNWMDEDPMD